MSVTDQTSPALLLEFIPTTTSAQGPETSARERGREGERERESEQGEERDGEKQQTCNKAMGADWWTPPIVNVFIFALRLHRSRTWGR